MRSLIAIYLFEGNSDNLIDSSALLDVQHGCEGDARSLNANLYRQSDLMKALKSSEIEDVTGAGGWYLTTDGNKVYISDEVGTDGPNFAKYVPIGDPYASISP